MSAASRPSIDDRLDALARDDKWYLSCGDGTLWAPPFPQWLHVPGFWDEAHVYYHPVQPLFAVALVDATGRAVRLDRAGWRWRPDRLDISWRPAALELSLAPRTMDGSLDTAIVERRAAHAAGRFVSSWRLPDALSVNGLWLVAFSMQPGESTTGVVRRPSGLAWRRTVTDRRGSPLTIGVSLTVAVDEPHLTAALDAHHDASAMPRGSSRVRCAALRSEGTVAHPVWLHTPFPERWASGQAPDGVGLDGISTAGFVHLAVAVPLGPDRAVAFTIQLAPDWSGAENVAHADAAVADTRSAEADRPPARSSVGRFFDDFPAFTCSDPFLARYYDYRLYGLYLNRLEGSAANVRHPCVAEGIGYFHVPITYSAPCHMWETRWAHRADLAFGSLRNFLAHQKPDGSFHGRIYSTALAGTDFYHANWGDAVLAALAVHDDEAFAREAYAGLGRYAEWLGTSRDPEGCGLFDIVDQFETGQEYMSRYLAVDEDADRHGWENRLRLKGIDVAVYAHQLFAMLETLSVRLGDDEGRARWAHSRRQTAEAIVGRCWNDEAGLFTDVVPGTLATTGIKAAVGFYPLLTDLVSDERRKKMLAHLADPATFGTPWPIPSSSADDPLFDANASWKGKRHVCPWNGRVWPMTTSHLVEGLLRQWHRGKRDVGALAADLLARYVRLMFDRQSLERPNCYEHYNPLTGEAAFYRGIDDYMHSWVLDLLVRGVAGLEPSLDGLRVDPLPFDLEWVRLERVRIRGRALALERKGAVVIVSVDGVRHETRVGEPLEIAW